MKKDSYYEVFCILQHPTMPGEAEGIPEHVGCCAQTEFLSSSSLQKYKVKLRQNYVLKLLLVYCVPHRQFCKVRRNSKQLFKRKRNGMRDRHTSGIETPRLVGVGVCLRPAEASIVHHPQHTSLVVRRAAVHSAARPPCSAPGRRDTTLWL